MKKLGLNFNAIVVAFCFLCGHSYSQTVKTIPFGENNFIKYNLSVGSYDVIFNGIERIKNAKIEVGNSFNNYTTPAHTKIKFSQQQLPGNAKRISITHTFEKGTTATQYFFINPGVNYFVTQVEIKGFTEGVNYLSALKGDVVLKQAGDNRAVFVPFDNDAWIRYKMSALEQANFTSAEVTTIYDNNDSKGFVMGSIQQTDWKSGISINATGDYSASINVFSGYADSLVTRDKAKHGVLGLNGTDCVSPKFMIGYFDNWQKGMEAYAACVANETARYITAWTKPKPMGWNSWGVIQTKLNETNTKAVVDFFADSCKAFRNEENTLYIDLDSYWDMFSAAQLKRFVAYCKQKGFRPGIYWAPFTDWGKNGDRKVEGSDFFYRDCWTKVNGGYHDFDGARAIDPTHPATKKRIAHFIKYFKDCGFEMIKIDFIGHAAAEADAYYDKNVHTGMQAFRQGMECLTNEIDGSMLVYVAISPNIATYRYAHIRRIACDAFRNMNETAYTLNSTGLGWWQNKLYDYVDADHVVLSGATEGENRARLASSLITGTVIMGDDYTVGGNWKEYTKQLLQKEDLLVLARQKSNFKAVNIKNGESAPEIFSYNDKRYTYIALFNYENNAKELNLHFSEFGLNKALKYISKELFSGIVKHLADNEKIIIQGKDAMILRIEQ